MPQLPLGLPVKTIVTLGVTALAFPAFGQDGPGRFGTLSITQGLEYSDNIDLTDPASSGTTARTGIDLGLVTETRTQRFTFSIGTDLVGEFGDGLSDDFEFQSSRAALTYSREGATSELGFSLNYSENQLEDDVFTPGDGSELIIDSGEAIRLSAKLDLDFGVGGPVETSIEATASTLDYQDTTDASLVDEEQVGINALTKFQLNQSLALRAQAGINRTTETDPGGAETDDTFVGLGFATETAGGLSITGDVIYDISEATTGATTTRQDGLGFELGLSQPRTNGVYTLDLSSRTDESGRRSLVEVGRSIDLPTGTLSLSIGALDQEGDDNVRVVGGLDYSRELPRGDITASLKQDATSSGGEPFLNTQLKLLFTQDINAVSGWEAELEYVASEDIAAATEDTRTTATITYSRDLTEDWKFNTGLSHTRVEEAGSTDRSSNSVFFNIRRDVTFGF